MESSIVGTRIRQRRRELGLTQAELATRIEISASYLNLIEWNKRRVPAKLLGLIANGLDAEPEELDGASERRLRETLTEIAHQPNLERAGVELDRTNELIARFPGWARGIAALAQAEHDAALRAQILSERMSNDPYLNETVHRMLTRIAAVRSAADILNEHGDLPAERRQRFTSIAAEESRMLSEVAEALANYLDKAEDDNPVLTPVDEVEALFEERRNHFEELEEAATDADVAFDDPRPRSRLERARQLAGDELLGIIEGIVSSASSIRSEAGRKRAFTLLFDYAVGAILMPIDEFSSHAADCSYDIEVLAETFSVEVESVCHRLTALRRAEGIPRFGYIRANAAGTIVEMLNLEGLSLPRYAAACPLWALYRAQHSPDTVIRQRAVFPSGARFVFAARSRHVGLSGFGRPRHYVTDMVAMTEADAMLTVYKPDPSAVVEEVGPSCRLCPRTNCLHRVEDPLT